MKMSRSPLHSTKNVLKYYSISPTPFSLVKDKISKSQKQKIWNLVLNSRYSKDDLEFP